MIFLRLLRIRQNIPTKESKKERLSFLPIAAVIIFAVVYMAPFWELDPISHSCFALLCAIAFLWSTEGIPAYATSYIVPLFSVWLGLGYDKSKGVRIHASKLATTYAWKFMDPIIFVFLGSMTMSECLTKYNVTDRVSRFVFRHLSKKPSFILLTLMVLNWAIAAFLSNVASTTLVLSFTMPIIRSLDPEDPFIKALLFGIAWSGNCGGMPTTIASPQNILALKHVHDTTPTRISFVGWMFYGVPVSLILLVAEWGYLMFRFKPERSQIIVGETEAEYAPWGIKHTFACLITAITIALWALNETFPYFLGNVGISSMIPVITFFGSGMLSVSDFHSIRWSTLALMGGGLALGEAMKGSGLLDLVSESSKKVMQGIALWPLLLIFLVLEGVLASLINSTSAAAILYPVIAILGESTNHPNLLVVLSAFMISGAQLFHISSFPNALISGVCRHKPGNPEEVTQITFLSGKEYPIYGWPTIIFAIVIIASVGYGIAGITL
jgi:phosphate transporter